MTISTKKNNETHPIKKKKNSSLPGLAGMRTSFVASLVIQFLIGFIDWIALRWDIRDEGKLLRSLLVIEFVVQTLEFGIYFFLSFLVFRAPLVFEQYGMTIRYIDWSITTPSMLFTLMVFLSECTSLEEYWKRYSTVTMIVIALDWCMLFLGFQHERRHDQKSWIHCGFYPFFFMFFIIYITFQKEMKASRWKMFLFAWFLLFWTLYGVVAFFSFPIRNSWYNTLDIFSKNVMGLFLVYLLSSFKQTKKKKEIRYTPNDQNKLDQQAKILLI